MLVTAPGQYPGRQVESSVVLYLESDDTLNVRTIFKGDLHGYKGHSQEFNGKWFVVEKLLQWRLWEPRVMKFYIHFFFLNQINMS